MTLLLCLIISICVNVVAWLIISRMTKRWDREAAGVLAAMEVETARQAGLRVEYRATLCLNSGVSLLAELHKRLQAVGQGDSDASDMMAEFAIEYNALALPYELRRFDGAWRLYVREPAAAATG